MSIRKINLRLLQRSRRISEYPVRSLLFFTTDISLYHTGPLFAAVPGKNLDNHGRPVITCIAIESSISYVDFRQAVAAQMGTNAAALTIGFKLLKELERDAI